MLDAAMLLYYLGLAPVLKNAAYQASSQEASVAQLADVERRLAGAGAGAADYARHLREAQHVFRDDIVDNTRLTTWNKVRRVPAAAIFTQGHQVTPCHDRFCFLQSSAPRFHVTWELWSSYVRALRSCVMSCER